MPPKSHILANQIPNSRHEKQLFKLFVKEVQETPQNNIELVASTKLEGTSLLLKISHTSDSGLGGSELVLTQQPPED